MARFRMSIWLWVAVPINCFTLKETGFGEEGEANKQAKNITTVFVQHFVFFEIFLHLLSYLILTTIWWGR